MTMYQPDQRLSVPDLDLLSVFFGQEISFTAEDRIIYAEADDPSVSVTKAQARIWTRRLAHLLRYEYGVGSNGPGKDVVAVFLSGQVALPILLFSVIAAGGVYSAVSVAYTPTELARTIKGGPSNILICSDDLRDTAVKAAELSGISQDRVLILGSRPEINVKTASGKPIPIPHLELPWTRITDRTTLAKLPICLLYSSGTTGLPKGVIITNRNIVAALIPATVPLQAWDLQQQSEGMPPYEYRCIAHLPASHIAGLQGYVINPAVADGTVYMMPRFDFVQFLNYAKKYKITFLLTVPPIWLVLLKSPAVTDQLQYVRLAISGAAPMAYELQKQVSAKLGTATGKETFIAQTWGLTETTGSATWTPWGGKDESGSVGWLFPNIEARIVGDNGQDVHEGERGEIWVKGPVITTGYWNNKQATEETFEGEWFKTGDIGFMKDNRFHCVDRKKELIKYKGNQVAPAELEGLLLSHPLILDAAVIGVEADPGDGISTELPRAYIVADQTKISEQEIKDFVKNNLASYKQLRGGVRFVDLIPKNPSGKILRRELREKAKREDGSKL